MRMNHARTELGGFAQLQSDESITKLQEDLMLDDVEPKAAQPDSTGTAAHTQPAGKVLIAQTADSSGVPAVIQRPRCSCCNV